MKIAILIFLISATIVHTQEATKILIFGGKTGWIGKKMAQLAERDGHTVIHAQSRLENRQDIIAEIDQNKPDRIINAAGLTGKPNVDWCEEHRAETIRVNLLGTVNLFDVAHKRNIHVTNISTGCIYEYDENHQMFSGKGFTEEDKPNFDGSFYSRTKIMLETLLKEYPNVLNLRVKMPISHELNKGFVGKIITFEKVVNIPNSMTVLDDLLPIAIDMSNKKITGIYNFVNPGTLSHNEVLDLYREHIDPHHRYTNFTIEEQAKILKARRANAELSAAKLMNLYPEIPDIKSSLIALFKRIKSSMQDRQQ